jgi:hypothetical protein
MAQAASIAGIPPDEVSFKGASQTFNAFLPYLLTATSAAEEAKRWAAMIAAIGEHRSRRSTGPLRATGSPVPQAEVSRANNASLGSPPLPQERRKL